MLQWKVQAIIWNESTTQDSCNVFLSQKQHARNSLVAYSTTAGHIRILGQEMDCSWVAGSIIFVCPLLYLGGKRDPKRLWSRWYESCESPLQEHESYEHIISCNILSSIHTFHTITTTIVTIYSIYIFYGTFPKQLMTHQVRQSSKSSCTGGTSLSDLCPCGAPVLPWPSRCHFTGGRWQGYVACASWWWKLKSLMNIWKETKRYNM